MVQHGSHEARLFNAVDPQNGSIQAELMVCVCVCVCVEGGRGGGHAYYYRACFTHDVYRENVDPSTLQILACKLSMFSLFHLIRHCNTSSFLGGGLYQSGCPCVQ